jgi:Uma2 family endonuclease
MREYLESGARLGWFLDPESRRAHVYRPGEPPQVLENPDKLSGEPELPGFVLNLRSIWEPSF